MGVTYDRFSGSVIGFVFDISSSKLYFGCCFLFYFKWQADVLLIL
jgi:hypothetical protein